MNLPGGQQQRLVRLGTGELPLAGADNCADGAAAVDDLSTRPQVGWMTDSSDLYATDDHSTALERLHDDGFLLLRGLVPRPQLAAGLRHFTHELQSRGVQFAPGTEPEQRSLVAPQLGTGAGIGIGDLQAMAHSPDISRILEGPELFSFFTWLFKEPAGTFDWKWTRVVPPGRRGGFHMGKV